MVAAELSHPLLAEPVKIANITSPSGALVKLAYEQKLFNAEGLKELQVVPYRMGRDGLKALLAGEVDLAIAYDTPILAAARKRAPIKILTAVHTSRRDMAVLVPKAVQVPSDLKGKTIGFDFGTSADYFFNLFLRRHGLNKRDVKVRNIHADSLVDAVKSKRIDAAVARYPGFDGLKELGMNAFDLDIYQSTVFLVATNKFIDENPNKVTSVLRALRKAEDYFYENPRRGWSAICQDEAGVNVYACNTIPTRSIFRLRVELTNMALSALETQNSLTDYGPKTIAQFNVRELIEPKFLKSICGECVLF